MVFNIFNVRLDKVGWVDAVDAADALAHAKRLHPGASVEQAAHEEQRRRQQERQDEVDFWRKWSTLPNSGSLTVWLVDGKTRMHLCETMWSSKALQALRDRGHVVQRTQQAPIPDMRSLGEIEEVQRLLDLSQGN